MEVNNCRGKMFVPGSICDYNVRFYIRKKKSEANLPTKKREKKARERERREKREKRKEREEREKRERKMKRLLKLFSYLTFSFRTNA